MYFYLTLLLALTGCATAPKFALNQPCTEIDQVNNGNALESLKELKHPTVFVDLDGTVGSENDQGKWTVFDGVDAELDKLSKKTSLVLLTGNSKKNVCELFRQHPAFARHFNKILTSDVYAPEFSKIIHYYELKKKEGKVDTKKKYSEQIFVFWNEHPEYIMPYGDLKGFKPPMAFSDWYEKVYNVHIAPDKSKVVGHDGILIDDEFAKPKPSSVYTQLIKEGRMTYNKDWKVTSALVLKKL